MIPEQLVVCGRHVSVDERLGWRDSSNVDEWGSDKHGLLFSKRLLTHLHQTCHLAVLGPQRAAGSPPCCGETAARVS